jgi:hypothetical protein
MANITEEHLHHMARRHHQTMKKLAGLQEKFSGFAERFVGTVETGAGAWLGGTIEGRTQGGTVMKVPINLGVGALFLAVGHLELAGSQWSGHLNNIGNGFIGSYIAATGYAFGKRWRETGKLLGGGGHPWRAPYGAPGWEGGAGPDSVTQGMVSGDLNEAQMAAIVQRMQAAAHG